MPTTRGNLDAAIFPLNCYKKKNIYIYTHIYISLFACCFIGILEIIEDKYMINYQRHKQSQIYMILLRHAWLSGFYCVGTRSSCVDHGQWSLKDITNACAFVQYDKSS